VEDILRSRSKTVGIVEQRFTLEENNILMVDVGGQRNERRKWIHAFDGVSFVIFIASLSEYDQVCDEDPDTDRMTEALNLFRDICKDKGFKKKPFILFLNKLDVFKEKIKKVDLKVCSSFHDYTGGCNEENAYNAIKEAFLNVTKGRKRKIVTKPTTATDTTLVQQVFDQAFALVLEEALGDLKG
jgi:guanine nucleotide-binding protein G(i) subunit alpha